jgi:hypothetical protein
MNGFQNQFWDGYPIIKKDDIEMTWKEVVIAMAQNLVPDICQYIISILEEYHITIGKIKWTKYVEKVNTQFTFRFRPSNQRRSKDSLFFRKSHRNNNTFIVIELNWRNYSKIRFILDNQLSCFDYDWMVKIRNFLTGRTHDIILPHNY